MTRVSQSSSTAVGGGGVALRVGAAPGKWFIGGNVGCGADSAHRTPRWCVT